VGAGVTGDLSASGLVLPENSTSRSPSAQQIDDQHHEPHNQEYVDQAATDMETETQKPQDEKNNKNCPKHGNLPLQNRKLISSHSRESCVVRKNKVTKMD